MGGGDQRDQRAHYLGVTKGWVNLPGDIKSYMIRLACVKMTQPPSNTF